MIINKSGLIIRMAVESLRVMGRATQGVRLINLRDDDSIAAVAKVDVLEGDEDDEFIDNEEGGEEIIEQEQPDAADDTPEIKE